jgi:hypothetical protein
VRLPRAWSARRAAGGPLMRQRTQSTSRCDARHVCDAWHVWHVRRVWRHVWHVWCLRSMYMCGVSGVMRCARV